MSLRNLIWKRWFAALAIVVALASAAMIGLQNPRQKPLGVGTQAGERWTSKSNVMHFRWCPAGTFVMGSPSTEPGRDRDEGQVAVMIAQGFWLGECEVTREQWQAVMGTTLWYGRESYFERNQAVIGVFHSHQRDSAELFCELLTESERSAGRLPPGWVYRLPTEAEWEYACRAGTTTAYAFGDDPSKLGVYARFGSTTDPSITTEAQVHAPGTRKPNPWGLYDMHGNAWEWCSVGATKFSHGREPPEGSSPEILEVLRGGGWTSSAADCRSAKRWWRVVTNRDSSAGFRVLLGSSLDLGADATRADD